MEPNAPPAANAPEFARSIRIAIVDDESEMVDCLTKLFTVWGHKVISASEPSAAYERLSKFRPHLVLLDLGPPVTDGITLAVELRRLIGFDAVCIVAFTGAGDDESRKRARAGGMDMFMVKPVQPDALQALVAAVAVAASPHQLK